MRRVVPQTVADLEAMRNVYSRRARVLNLFDERIISIAPAVGGDDIESPSNLPETEKGIAGRLVRAQPEAALREGENGVRQHCDKKQNDNSGCGRGWSFSCGRILSELILGRC